MNIESSVAITENYIRAEVLQATMDQALQVAALCEPSRLSSVPSDGTATEAVVEAAVSVYEPRRAVTTAIIRMLDLVDDDEFGDGSDAGSVWAWLQGMHDDGIVNIDTRCLATTMPRKGVLEQYQ